MHYHFIGICGVGMAATAKLLQDQGHTITGSDQGAYPPMSTYLETLGIEIMSPYQASNIPAAVDCFVIGKNAKLVAESNEEVSAAEGRAQTGTATIKSFAEIIGEIVVDRHNIVVAGSFGKSSTTAIVSSALAHAGKNPGYLIGAKPTNTPYTSALGTPEAPFVLEGDEYPSANFDDRSKFLHYHARDIILTSGTHDHLNVFPTLESYHQPFITLLQNQPTDGLLVACLDGEHIDTLLTHTTAPVVTYSFENTAADFYGTNFSFGATSSFDLMHAGKKIVTLETPLLGRHNIQNIIGASALLLSRELLTPDELQAAILDFPGVERRLERKNPTGKIPVYEGFGSSLSKLRAAIDALKLHFPDKKIVVVFDPYEFSWRNCDAISWYDTAFLDCHEVHVNIPAGQGATTHKQLTQDEIVERIKQSGITATPITDPQSTEKALVGTLTDEHVVLMISSGTLGGLIQTLPKALS